MILQVFVRKNFLNLNFTGVCPENILKSFFGYVLPSPPPPPSPTFWKKYSALELKFAPGPRISLCGPE